ncbi:unannotated protein [freshwater metagenome]|uniref:Unannotated protein n=1 Tax=freshwater metagenome TaxID=449393 RepID=A0A6J5ZMY0_9ZZZZ
MVRSIGNPQLFGTSPEAIDRYYLGFFSQMAVFVWHRLGTQVDRVPIPT